MGIYPWIADISTAIMATLLVIYADTINRMLKRQIRGLHFLFRTLIFILLCAFGYGALLIYAAPMLTKLLAPLGIIYLGPLVVCLFIALGTIAEKKNRI